MSTTPQYTCPCCGNRMFYGTTTSITTYYLNSDGCQQVETDNEGDTEQIECSRCGQSFDTDAFIIHGLLVRI